MTSVLSSDWDSVDASTISAFPDFKMLEASQEFLIPEDAGISMSGASSDMLIIDLGNNTKGCEVGDHVSFGLKYMGAVGLLNSNYITKNVVN